MSDESRYQLLVSFPDQSHSFCHGFEAGKLWERMTSGREASITTTTRFENREVIRRLAASAGWALTVEETSVEGWDETSMEKTAEMRPNPVGLTIVK